MSRLIIGRDGRIVSSYEPDDWLQAQAGATQAPLETVITPAGQPLHSSRAALPLPVRGTRSSRRRVARTRRLVVATATMTVGLIALLLVILLAQGQHRPSDDAAPSVTGQPNTAARSIPDRNAIASSEQPAVQLPERGRLWLGDRGANVKRLQTALLAAGLNPGARDGIYGRRTRSAVTRFQAAHRLTPDGIVGPKTAAALNTTLAGHGG